MEGIYKIYIGDKLVCEQKNSLTNVGRSLILKSILGLIPSVAGSIVVGVDGTANPAADSTTGLINLNNMMFSIAQSPVALTSLEATGTKDALIFKTTFSDKMKYTIYEVGLYPSQVNNQAISPVGMLLYSGAGYDGWKIGSANVEDGVSPNTRIVTADVSGDTFRIGNEAVFIKAGDTITSESIGSNISQYGDKDIFKLAIDPATTGTITVAFYTNDTNYYSKQFTISSTGYQVLQCTKDAFTATLTPSWDSIIKASILATSTNIIFDGMKFDDADNIDANYGLISRAALSTPIAKTDGNPITIEYYLSLGFNRPAV